MMVGFTGHQSLPPQAKQLMTEKIDRMLREYPSTKMLCSLAEGADQEFATSGLAGGAELHVVVPCDNYHAAFQTEEAVRMFEDLVGRSTGATYLPFPKPSDESFMAAGLVIVERCDLLLAVWDGKPAAGLGGTADVVAYAQQIGRKVERAWPEGVAR